MTILLVVDYSYTFMYRRHDGHLEDEVEGCSFRKLIKVTVSFRDLGRIIAWAVM